MPDNLYAAFRQQHLPARPWPTEQATPLAFFPGCALAAFTPDLAVVTFEYLKGCFADIGWLDGCCFDPLEGLGFAQRFESASRQLQVKVSRLGVRQIVTACPTCYYRLTSTLAEIQVVSIYGLLAENRRLPRQQSGTLAVHDACPDRFTRALGSQVRDLVGCQPVSLKHEGRLSLCCGAGGDACIFDPEQARAMSERVLAEVKASGATTLVTYCTTCAVQLARYSDSLRVAHVLDLLFGTEHDFGLIGNQVAQLLQATSSSGALET